MDSSTPEGESTGTGIGLGRNIHHRDSFEINGQTAPPPSHHLQQQHMRPKNLGRTSFMQWNDSEFPSPLESTG
ncbi:hypothetical protein BG004_006822, partial [Podila humilis]